MKRKRFVTLLLAALLAVSVAACAPSQEDPASSPDPAQESSSGVSSENRGDESSGAAQQEAFTVKILAPGEAKSEDCVEVAQLASAITKEKFNTELELIRVGFGSYNQQVNLMLASGEKLDLFYQWCGAVTSAISSGQILPINDYLETVGTDMKGAISDDDWACVTIGGNVYGVPSNKEKATGWGFAVNKEMADATGIDYMAIKSEEELEPLLQKAKELFPGTYPVVGDTGGLSMMADSDDLGGDAGVLLHASEPDTTVVNFYATDFYREKVELRYDWAQKGLIIPDASTTTEQGNSLLGSEKGFGRFANTKPGMDMEIAKESGKDIAIINLIDAYTTTGRVDIVWYVPHNSENPQRAVEILNEMYMNPELSNILINGIEGKHYEYVNDEQTVINFPEGINGTSTSYLSLTWAWPNGMITPIWEGNSEDLWDELVEYNRTAHVSPAKGFTWDNTDVQNEAAACANVVSKYNNALSAGSLNPDEALPKFLQELEDAGVNTIVEEKQRQLDEWLAANA